METPLIAEFKGLIRPYMFWSGLFQGWDMFAPEPRSVNAYVEAAVIYKDGRIHNWKFPRMEQLGLTERYYRERYRKYVENLQVDSNAALWPDAARRIARLNEEDPSNPPAIVMLIRYWSDIVPRPDGSYRPEPSRARIFFEYNVKPEDLK